MEIETARELVAQAWCQPTTEAIEMDVTLAEEFAKILAANSSKTTVPVAMACLREAMKDDHYANGWHANIAVLLTDEGVDYERAQERASGFMRLVFDRPTLDLTR